jgi:ribosomal protein S27AE
MDDLRFHYDPDTLTFRCLDCGNEVIFLKYENNSVSCGSCGTTWSFSNGWPAPEMPLHGSQNDAEARSGTNWCSNKGRRFQWLRIALRALRS